DGRLRGFDGVIPGVARVRIITEAGDADRNRVGARGASFPCPVRPGRQAAVAHATPRSGDLRPGRRHQVASAVVDLDPPRSLRVVVAVVEEGPSGEQL